MNSDDIKHPHIIHWVIEGVDRLGKSSLIDGIVNRFGYHHIVHYAKPVNTAAYKAGDRNDYYYQADSFRIGFRTLMSTGVPVIFDRFHLGECVYANMYRGYDGGYVHEIEKEFNMQAWNTTRLILLTTSNFDIVTDDGLSFDFSKKEQEQEMFIRAFNKSIFKDKVLVDVHDGNGQFKPFAQILDEVSK